MQSCSHLFIYSSLRLGFDSEGFQYLRQFFDLVSTGKVKGIMSVSANGPVATPTEEPHFLVGDLYRLKDESQYSWVFGQLDGYEGLCVEADEHPLYRRETTKVILDNGTTETSWIYWFNGNVEHLPVIPSGDVYDFVGMNG